MNNNDLRDQLFRELFDLSGQMAIVTGARGRLGREYVRTLSMAGAKVAAFDIDDFDVTNRAAVEDAVARAAASLGTPTILVNNAGMGSSPVAAGTENGPFEDYPEVAWDTMIDSHLKGSLFVAQAFVRQFKAGGATAGSIINVSSTYGLVSPDQAVYEYKRGAGVPYFKPVGYSVAKSGVLNFTRWLAEYGAPLGIRANTLVPGGVKEDGHAPEFVTEYVKRTPLGRMAEASDYNGAVLFLASRASSYMTGAMVVVDGGWTAR